MAVSAIGTAFLVLSFICVIPGCALLWRVYDSDSAVKGNWERLAQYESCSFLFFFVVNAAIAYGTRNSKAASVLRVTSIGILLYITVFGEYVNFNNLNNLRIVEMSDNKQYNIPNTATTLSTPDARRLLGGLILGWFSLFFGLLSSVETLSFSNAKGMGLGFWVLALVLAIPGVVVCWSNGYVPTYAFPQDDTARSMQEVLFKITTVTIVEFVVLTVGIMAASNEILGASAFIFGVFGAFIPIGYFYLQSFKPSDSDYIWAGPILCWISTFCMCISASFSESAGDKSATV